jgi:hypothetical protein
MHFTARSVADGCPAERRVIPRYQSHHRRANGEQTTSRITSSSPSEGSGKGPRTTSGTVEPTADERQLSARVLEQARERARVLREAQKHETETGTVGSFELVPDRDL